MTASTIGAARRANIPAYITDPVCSRYYVDRRRFEDSYGTATTSPAWMYPLDGNRFVLGNDPITTGGDVWIADAGIKVMEKEPDWSGMLVSLVGRQDGHMWGITDDAETVRAGRRYEHGPPAVRRAHRRRAGRPRGEEARDQGQLDETLIVLTTDHAGQPSTRFHGVNEARSRRLQLVLRRGRRTRLPRCRAVAGAADRHRQRRFSYQDSAWPTWLTDTSRAAKREAAA